LEAREFSCRGHSKLQRNHLKGIPQKEREKSRKKEEGRKDQKDPKKGGGKKEIYAGAGLDRDDPLKTGGSGVEWAIEAGREHNTGKSGKKH